MQDQEGRHLLPVGYHLLPACPFVFSHVDRNSEDAAAEGVRRSKPTQARRGRRARRRPTQARRHRERAVAHVGSPRSPHTPTPNAHRRQQCILLGFFPPTYCS